MTVDFNASLAVYLTNVPTLENSALILLFSVFWSNPRSHVWLGCDKLFTWLTVLTRTPVFQGHRIYSSGSCGNSRDLGRSAVWSTALESGEHA